MATFNNFYDGNVVKQQGGMKMVTPGTQVDIEDDSIVIRKDVDREIRRIVIDRSIWEGDENAGWNIGMAVATALTHPEGLDEVQRMINRGQIEFS